MQVSTAPPKKYRIDKIAGLKSMRRELHRMAEFFGRHLGVKIESDDFRSATSLPGGGVRFSLGLGSSTASGDLWHNFQPYDLTSASCKIGDGTVTLGTVTRPTIGGTAINASSPPTLTLSAGLNYIYLKLVLSPVTSSGYVTTATLTSAEIEAKTSLQTSSGNTLWIPLSQVNNGIVTHRTQYTNISISARDDGTATSTALYDIY